MKSTQRLDKFTPMRHQAVSLKHDEKNALVFDTSEPGTGKTAVRIWGFAKRHAKNKKRALVLAPRSLLSAVWLKDFKKFAPHLRVSVAYAHNRDAAFEADADVYVTNHDAVKWLKTKRTPWFKKKNFGELIVDEMSAYKHSTSQRSRAVKTLAKRFEQRKGMTGTPNTLSITDVWHQVYILDDGERLGGSFIAFRNACCTPGEQEGPNANALRWVDKDGIEEVVFAQIGDIVVRHMLDDCADIPPNHHYTMPFILPPRQKQAIADIQRTRLLAFEDGKVTAVNAAALAIKLLQVASGAVYTEDGKYTTIDKARYEMVLDLAMERQQPLVFFYWKHQRDLLAAEAKARGLNYAVVDGSTSDEYRAQAEAMYQAGKIDGILAHPKTMAHGFTLTAGTSTIWASPTQNLEWFDQGSRRQRRIGQTKKTETIMVLADNPVEEAVYADLQAKDVRMSNFLKLIHEMTKEIK